LIQEKKKAEYEERRQKMISDREDRKMARFLPLKKEEMKENTGTAEAVNSICRHCKTRTT
jgi:hypothetical protein